MGNISGHLYQFNGDVQQFGVLGAKGYEEKDLLERINFLSHKLTQLNEQAEDILNSRPFNHVKYGELLKETEGTRKNIENLIENSLKFDLNMSYALCQ